MAELSIVIPARNEMFLARTIENILANIEGDTEIITCLDGAWADPGIVDNPKVILIHYSQSIGQRAATNQAVRLSKAKYVMKCDAHCAFDKGFDIKMVAEMHDDWTMVPIMKNLHAFDWVCPDGHRRYQGPSGPCKECGKETTRDVVWIAKPSPNSVSYCFDATPHFQYFGAYAKRPEGAGEITETMSLQGSCWMLTRDKYWELNVCDENFGGWGSQGIEVAVKTWLSGGRVMVNKKTWYAHMFRTQGGDFGFPYPIKASDQEKAKIFARDLFFNDKWDKQVRPFSWLIEKFWPVPGWTDEDLKKLKANTFKFPDAALPVKSVESEPTEDLSTSSIIYSSQATETETPKKVPKKEIVFYTDSQLKLKIAYSVQRQLTRISRSKGIPILSVSLKSMSFGDKNIILPDLKKGHLTNLKMILAGLKESDAEVVFICENNVLYHPSHFDFVPSDKEIPYYNENIWRLNPETGQAIHDGSGHAGGIVAYRETAIKMVEIMMKKRPKDHRFAKPVNRTDFVSEFPNIEILSGDSLKSMKGKRDQEIPGWGKTADLIRHFQ
jgi:glycosyltransferase involved in cell wall biosynthesis